MQRSRRHFLRETLAAGSTLTLGCSDDPGAGVGEGGLPAGGAGGELSGGGAAGGAGSHEPVTEPGDCNDPFDGGEYLGKVDFVGETKPLNVRLREGLDGRLYTDLSLVTRERPTLPNETFYIRTFTPDRLIQGQEWRIAVDGLASKGSPITMAELTPLARPMGRHVLECAGNGRDGGFGLLSAADWAGVPIADVLELMGLQPGATHLRVTGFDDHSQPSLNNHSTPGAAWVFRISELKAAGAFLATEMNGETLPQDHGFPVRLLVPGWYGCSCIKWVNAMTGLGEDAQATSQMKEFASRTHQHSASEWARDYAPATQDQAAMPIAIERWKVDGALLYRVVGIMWGGDVLTDALSVQFGGGSYERVEVCPKQTTNATWTFWTHAWSPDAPGRYAVRLRVDDPIIATNRLDTGYYAREVSIDAV